MTRSIRPGHSGNSEAQAGILGKAVRMEKVPTNSDGKMGGGWDSFTH